MNIPHEVADRDWMIVEQCLVLGSVNQDIVTLLSKQDPEQFKLKLDFAFVALHDILLFLFRWSVHEKKMTVAPGVGSVSGSFLLSLIHI